MVYSGGGSVREDSCNNPQTPQKGNWLVEHKRELIITTAVVVVAVIADLTFKAYKSYIIEKPYNCTACNFTTT